MIREWIQQYQPASLPEAERALREVMQQVALAGLQRSGFFEHGAFYGGTALRIFYGLPRFSEDLDFSLLQSEPGFSFHPFLAGIKDEFEALGMQVTVREKIKSKTSAIDSAFLKAGTALKELTLTGIENWAKFGLRPDITIKIEVDTNPPLSFKTEEKLLLQPFSFYTKCFILADLFAGKMHALLFRKWRNRIKGRDWFDLEWYIRRGVPLDLTHFEARARQSGDWKQGAITAESLLNLLNERISTVSFDNIRADVLPFVENAKQIEIWSAKYFRDLVKQLKFTS